MKEIRMKMFENRKILIAPFNTKMGLSLASTDFKTALLNPNIHFKVINSLFNLFHQDIVFPLMDVFLEANAIKRKLQINFESDILFDKIDELKIMNINDDLYVKNNYETIRLMKKKLPENVIKGAFITAPFTIASILNGIKKTKKVVLNNDSTFVQLLEFIEHIFNNSIEKLIDYGAEFICVLDPMASFLNLNNVEDFSFKFLSNAIKFCENKNVISCLHICGNITPIINKISSANFNVLSIDSEDAGVNFSEIYELIPDNLILMGNLNPQGNLFYGYPKDIHNDVVKLLAKVGKKNNFILGTGCDMLAETPFQNMVSFINSGRMFGK